MTFAMMTRFVLAGMMLAPAAGFAQVYDHNGSDVRVEPELGLIVYEQPKRSIADVVKPGTVLFRGKVGYSGSVSGTAYAFKKGCPPAEYPVTGRFDADNSAFVVRGAGPVREGCEVVGYSQKSPHSSLRFVSKMSP